MATVAKKGELTYIDNLGNKTIMYPYTKKECITDLNFESVTKTITLFASKWDGNVYSISDPLITLESNQDVYPSLDVTKVQLEILSEAILVDGGQSVGEMKLKALGTVPTVDIKIRVTFSKIQLPTISASDTVTLSTKNDSGNGIRFGIDANGNYGYIKAGADSVVPFKKGTIGVITGGNNAPNQTLSNLVAGEIYVGSLLGTEQNVSSNLFTSGAKLISSRYVSFSQSWYTNFVVFEATETTAKMKANWYLAYAKVE